ncbi:hypothetical protein ORV05_07890 [Amycolatopsis cynarae]|uniref:PPE domain-containing protein n=1 Tax=Amycolatopsis cynarae TaxID=2995223 RepID=A0ABY7B5S3_9PSEU|nr:hypothetical protein [Amycolatopsis sp. HUAS 11-8]WAL67691.1 hypothetical protein ORV05_07890 [Amycolatopsis sp. HUAS 11-8]
MTQPDNGSDGYTPRLYEAEVYAGVSGANAKKNPWLDPDWQDPTTVAGKYSIKSRQMYEAKLAAEGTGYRPGMDPSDVFYRSMPHEQMISMVHDGVSAQDVDEKGLVINKLGNAFKHMSTTLQQAVTKEQAGWQGAGAEAAFQYLGGLARWSDTAGDAAFLTANRYSQTSAAVANAQNSMPEPAGRSVAQSMDLARQQFHNGNFMDGIATLKDAQNQATLQFQAQQQAAAVLTARDQTLYSTASTQPMYTAPPPPPRAATATAPTGTTPGPVVGGSVESVTVPDVGRTTAASAGVSSPAAGAGPTPNIAGGAGSAPTAPVQGGATTTGSSPSWGSVPGPGTDGGWLRSHTPTSGPGPSVGVGLIPPGRDAGSGNDSERGGSSRGSGGSGNSSGRATGRTPNGAAEENPGSGKRSGAAEPSAKAAAEATRAGAAGKAGKTGVNGMPGAAGGKKSEEDKERKRPGYVVDGNPNETYGLNIETDEQGNKIAPPVIGT